MKTAHVAHALAAFAIAGLTACAGDATAPAAAVAANAAAAEASVFAQPTATVYWHSIARTLTNKYGGPQQKAARLFAYLSRAEYQAVLAADDDNEDFAHPSARGAVAGASAVVLAAAFPAEQSTLDATVATEAAMEVDGRSVHGDWAAGEALGRQIGGRVVADEASDRFILPWSIDMKPSWATWSSLTGALPVFPRLGEMRPFFLVSGDQFRPAAPPQPGSPEFAVALDVVRQAALNRTAADIAIAQFWAKPGGYLEAQAYNDQIATDLVTRHHLNERRAAHAVAMVNMAAMDAFIACHDAKYTYWLLRPVMADHTISMAIPLPNHPSYPSNHACVTGASMAVLARLFPNEERYVTGLADEAARSRIVAGIHYPFDATVGLALGRSVAAYAIAHDSQDHDDDR